jgi:hypothetical protein
MATIKTMTLEFGRDYSISTVTMNDGQTAKVIGMVDSEATVTWMSESESGVTLEDFALDVVKKCFDGILDVVTGG